MAVRYKPFNNLEEVAFALCQGETLFVKNWGLSWVFDVVDVDHLSATELISMLQHRCWYRRVEEDDE